MRNVTDFAMDFLLRKLDELVFEILIFAYLVFLRATKGKVIRDQKNNESK